MTFARPSTRRRGLPMIFIGPPLAHSRRPLRRVAGRCAPHRLPLRRLDRLEDLLIAGAAAEAAGQRLADLIARRVRVLVEQRLGGDQECRACSSRTARRRGRRRPPAADAGGRRSPALRPSSRAPVALDAEHQARQHRLAVEQHGARAALAELAAVLGAAEVQILTQHLEQRLVRRERDLGRLAVDGQGDVVMSVVSISDSQIGAWDADSEGRRRRSRRRARRPAAATAVPRGGTSARSS